ncbi:MAG TPA: hypothetical protein PLO78_05320 [Candidatus Omnitrophota bacterium]|nr:hypothetical protein [Candidatus Omnitrophota bacterium]
MLGLDYKRNDDFKTKVICDIPINEREIYRISNKEYRGMRHVDLRVFARAIEDPARLIPRIEGLWIERELLGDVIEGLTLAKNTPARRSLCGAEENRIIAWQFYISEWDIYRFYKLRKKDAQFVELRRMMLNVGRKWSPYYRKGTVIEMRLIERVIAGLERAKRARSL